MTLIYIYYLLFGSQVYPQLLQRLTVLLAPIKPLKKLAPLAPVVIDVEPHFGHRGTFLGAV